MLTVDDAKRRATIRLPDGRLAILLAVHVSVGTIKVWHAGRHETLPGAGATLSEIDLHPHLSGAVRRRLGLEPVLGHRPPPTSVDVS